MTIRPLLAILLTAAGTAALAAGELSLAIVPAAAAIKRGDQLRVEATLTNTGTSPVILVLPGDGSFSGWRTPIIRWSYVAHDSPQPYSEQFLGTDRFCGNINALRQSEVFTLLPSASRVLNEWINPVVDLAPGRYRLKMHYINEPSRKISGIPLGAHETGVVDVIRRSTACKVVSNEVSLIVTE
jgi:hypothetical protein